MLTVAGRKDEDDTPPGRLVQYYTNGPGFTPTTATVGKIPAGVYQIKSVNMMPTLVPQTMVTDELLRLPDSKSDMVIAEIDKFWTLGDKFKQHGIEVPFAQRDLHLKEPVRVEVKSS